MGHLGGVALVFVGHVGGSPLRIHYQVFTSCSDAEQNLFPMSS